MPEEIAARVLSDAVYYRSSLRSAAEDFFSRNPSLDYVKPVVRVLTLGVARNYMLLDRALEIMGYGPPSHSYKWMLARVLAFEAVFGKVKRGRVEKLAPKAGLDPEDVFKLKELRPRDVVKGLSGVDRLSVLYSTPRWILEELLEARVPDVERLLETLNRDPTRWIRVRSDVDKSKLAKSLREQGVIIEWDHDLPDVARIVEGDDKATRTREYSEGLYTLQDKASALVAHVAGPQAKLLVDVTGGAAVKATHAAWLGAKYVGAGDVKPLRAAEALRVARRLRVDHLLEVFVADGRRPPLRKVDVLIVDPPCTDVGRLQYEPEVKMWLTRGDLKFFRRLQYQLLRAALELVDRGCKVVYSVCTLTKSETVWVVRRALESVGDAELVKAEPFLGDPVPGAAEAQRLYPHKHSTQGFFIAVLKRV